MQFEVHGEGWNTLWTEEARITIALVLLFIVVINMLTPMGADPCKEKSS